jgi:zinc protease
MDSEGASLGASSGYELSSVTCSGRTKSLELCLKMVADLVIRPTFPKKEMGEIRDQLLTAVKQTRDDPNSLAAAHFDNVLYGDDHPGGRPMTEESVQAITRRDLTRLHRHFFVPGAAILGISGDIDPAALQKTIKKMFGPWRKGKEPVRKITPVKDPPSGLRVLLIDKPDLSQSFFSLGHAGIHRKHPDRDAVTMMNYVLGGGGFSSRLMEVLRVKGGKTYGVRSEFLKTESDGSFVVGTFTKNSQLVEAIQMVRKELARLAGEPPTEAEIKAAKGKIAGGYAIRFRTAASIVKRLMWAQIWDLPDSDVVELPLRIDRLSRDQVGRAASQHLHPLSLVAAVVGKAKEVAPLLKQAEIPFTRISYLDPISARDRKKATSAAKISDKDLARAARVLKQALKKAGGRARLGKVRSLRMTGTAKVEAGGTTMEGTYSALILLPDHMRLTITLPGMSMSQVLAGDRSFLQVGPQKKDFPPDVLHRMQAVLWRDPILVPLNAMSKGTRYRIAKQDKKQLEVELYPEGLPPATLILDKRSHHILQIRHKDQQGSTRISELGQYKKVKGILVPHRSATAMGGRRQTVELSKVEINPKLTKKDILGATP